MSALSYLTRRAALCAAFAGALIALDLSSAAATNIERVVSPGGIEVWLVRDPSAPLIAFNFAFRGGSAQDPSDKPGVAHMAAALLDEGAGDLDARSFHERLETKAIELSFAAGRDHMSGSVRTLTENQSEAFQLLRLALTAPRFDGEAVERIRDQILSSLRRETTNPTEVAYRRWWETAFPGHPYGRPTKGSLETVPTITSADLKAFTQRVFARDKLKVAIVGNVDAATAGKLTDEVFGTLPAKAALEPVAAANPQGLGRVVAVDLDVPQSVLVIGGSGIARRDPDFMAAYIVNHILGGGSFSSRLYREVREVRGLAYSVYSTLVPMDYAALFMGQTATRADRAGQTLQLVEQEIRRIAAEGPTADELAKAKSFLKGSFALRFDTSSKIASQLVAIQLDDLGIDYINKRNDLVDAVTLTDVQRVAKRLLDGGMLVTLVGRPQTAAKAQGG